MFEDFWRHVEIKGPDDCWPWRGPIFPNTIGYGRYERRTAKVRRQVWTAHRFALAAVTWPDKVAAGSRPPRPMQACHTCDNPPCCNPAHGFWGLALDNVHDCVTKGRFPTGTATPQAKLTEAAVREIRASSEPHVVLAARYGVCYQAIQQVRTGRAWVHVQ